MSSAPHSIRGMIRPVRVFASAALALTVAACVTIGVEPSATPSDVSVATVIRVIDGDTIVASSGGTEERVRFIGMDTPERSDPLGPRATAFLKDLLPVGTSIVYKTDVGQRDRYGRLLAYVWLFAQADQDPEHSLNARLLSAGWARTMTIAPNVAHADLFADLQRKARTAKRGMWATEPFPSRS